MEAQAGTIQSAAESHFTVLTRLQTSDFNFLKDYSSCYGEESTGGNIIILSCHRWSLLP